MGGKKSKQQVYSICEDLSNELIYELFDYLSYNDIYHAFGNLNQRCQNLIDTHSHYINLQQYIIDNPYPLPRYIRTLKVNARYQFSLIRFLNIISLHGLILANLPPLYLLQICDTVSLKELEYVYLGLYANYRDGELEKTQLAEIQQKILLLGEIKLTKCVFRMMSYADIDQLSWKLSALEYLRIDGCENVFIVNNLLERMPNLRSLHVLILGSVKMDDQYKTQNIKNHSLTTLIIRISNLKSPEELIPLFSQQLSSI